MVKYLEDFSPLKLVQIFDDYVNRKPLKPQSLAYSHKAKRFFALEKNEIIAIDSQQERDPKRSTKKISPALIDKSLIVYDDYNQRLLLLTPKQQLIAIATNPDGSLNTDERSSFDLSKLVREALDITIDQATGRIFVLQKKSISSILPDAQGSLTKAEIVQVALPPEINYAKRIAFDPATRNLQVLSFPKEQQLYELDQTGQLIAIRDVSEFGFQDPNKLVFAPTSDATDASKRQNLFVADTTGAGITELSLAVVATPPPSPTRAILVRTTETSQYFPASPDPSGITYLPGSNTLLIVDGEVEEMPPIFAGSNLFEVNLNGTLVRSGSTLSYTNEPTGVSFNPDTGHIFVSDDDDHQIFEIAPGTDGKFGTADDVIFSQIDTHIVDTDPNDGDIEGDDAEDVIYVNDVSRGIKALFIGGGVDGEIYRINPGVDGNIGTADDVVSSFDTASMGLNDVEGVAYNQDNGHLYALSGDPNGLLFEMTADGTFVQTIDISAANPLNPAGLVFAPSSQNPGAMNLYVVARGVDNDTNPNENDGKLYEFILTNNIEPTVDAGVSQIVQVNPAVLDGTISDDGLPNPPGTITSSWSKLSGPGNVTFGNANAVDTTATFDQAGTYLLRLTASDGELTSQDEVAVSYNSTFYVSSADAGTVSGMPSYGDEDILAYNANTGTWSMVFDGSDVGLGASGVDIDAFLIDRNATGNVTSIMFSVEYTTSPPFTLPGGVVIDNADIVKFTPTSVGNNTSGTYQLYFDGSDVGLDASGEDIDAFGILPDGRLLISTSGNASVPGAIVGAVVNGSDEDLLAFSGTTGSNTAGTWIKYFDGSDLALNTTSDEDIDASWVDKNGNIYLSTRRDYYAAGANGTVSGDGNNIFTFIPNSVGENTRGNLLTVWDGTTAGLVGRIDGFGIA
jgi:hypothetical protein